MAHAGLRRPGRGGRARDRAVPRARRADRRHGAPDALPGDLPARATRTYRPIAALRTMFIDGVDRRRGGDDRRAPPQARTRRWRSPSCACSAAPWRACRPTRRRSPTATERVMANVAAIVRGTRTGYPSGRPGSTELSAELNQGDDRPTSASSARRATARVRAAYPGATWERLAAGQGRSTTRTTCSGSTRTSRLRRPGKPELEHPPERLDEDPRAHLRRSDATVAKEDRDLADPGAGARARGRSPRPGSRSRRSGTPASEELPPAALGGST